MESTSRLLSVARGDTSADLLLVGGRVINTFTGEIEGPTDIAIVDGRVAGIGAGYSARERVDLKGAYVSPGLIDAHVHIESSLCVPAEFAAAILPRGVTAVVTDPHEIANVAGAAGVRFIADASRHLPLDVTVLIPSCVPATHMATSGGTLSASDIRSLRDEGIAGGLAEVMNFPGVISGEALMLEKIAALADRPVDGHCPGVVGKRLNAYAAAGIGSDHESVSAEEAKEKLSRGLYLLIREATNARNLDALLPIITPGNSRRICFCTDDRTPVDLLNEGSVDEMVRRAIAYGVPPIEAIRMATLNPAEWFGLKHLGAIAPGRLASLFVFDDLQRPEAKLVFAKGKLVAQDGKGAGAYGSMPTGAERQPGAEPASDSSSLATYGQCKVGWDNIRWTIPARTSQIRVIGSLPDQLVTDHRILPAKVVDGFAVADPSRDVLKMLVIERHHGTGQAGLGFVQGFGLKRGAIAGTVAHDHHNLVVIGADDVSMQTAARAAATGGGGLAVAVGEQVIARLSLPVAGLMSDRPVAEVAKGYSAVISAAKELGSGFADPFMAMSFMALEVIPALKLTDLGLVDVEAFRLVELFV